MDAALPARAIVPFYSWTNRSFSRKNHWTQPMFTESFDKLYWLSVIPRTPACYFANAAAVLLPPDSMSPEYNPGIERFHTSRADTLVTQICNLPYRRIVFCRRRTFPVRRQGLTLCRL